MLHDLSRSGTEGGSDYRRRARPGCGGGEGVLAEGCKVAIVDISGETLAQTAAELGAGADRLITVTADVSKEEDVQRYVAETVAAFGTASAVALAAPALSIFSRPVAYRRVVFSPSLITA